MPTIDRQRWMDAARRLSSWRRPLILSHIRPDGDAIGAMLGISRMCRRLGADPMPVAYEDPPAKYRDLVGNDRWTLWPAPAAAGADGILVLDTCSWQQLAPVAEFLRASPMPRIVVDHHKTRDDISGAAAKDAAAVEYLIDESASAASLLVHEWLRAAGWPVEAGVAEALFVGIATDTGWFRFSNTDARTMTAAGDLIAAGAQPDRWFTAMYETASLARVRLEGAMLSAVEVSDGGAVVWTCLTRDMFAASGASPGETEDLIQHLQRMAGVVVSALFVEEPDGRVRASLRSRAPHVCGYDVDVAAIAAAFGGGGHARAAGARLAGPLAAVQQQVLAAVREAVVAARARKR